MWQLQNHTPYAARTGFYRDHQDAIFWGLWIKAAFALRADRPPLFLRNGAVVYDGPLKAPDDPEMPLADSDLQPPKAAVDLLLTARAMQPATADPKPILFRLGDWQRDLLLMPPRRRNWRGLPTYDRDAPPQCVLLNGRASHGGPDHPDNPLGCDGSDSADAPLPVLISPEDQGARRGRASVPVTIGALAPHWPGRVRLAGTYDKAWQETRAPLLPRDFDPAWWQAAPVEQRLSRPLPSHPVLEAGGLVGTGPADAPSRYPLASPGFDCATRIAGRWHRATPELQTIRVDFDSLQAHMTWLASWRLARPEDDVTIDTTRLAAGATDSFRVLPEDAALFDASPSGLSFQPESAA